MFSLLRVYFSDFWLLIDGNYQWVLVATISFLFLTFLDILGLGLILPVLAASMGSTQAISIPFFEPLFEIFSYYGLGANILFLIFVWSIKAILGVLLNQQIFKFAYENQKRIIDTVSQSYQSLSFADYISSDTGAMIQNMIVNVENVAQQTIVAGCRLVAETFTFSFLLILLFFASPMVTLLSGLVLFIGMLVYFMFAREAIAETGKRAAEARVNLIGSFNAVMDGFKEIRVLNANRFFNESIEASSHEIRKNAVIYKTLSIMPKYLFEVLAMVILGITFLVGSRQGMNPAEIFLLLGLFVAASLRLVPAINNITSSVSQMRNSHYALQKVLAGLRLSSEAPPVTKVRQDRALIEKSSDQLITFSNVSFSYSLDSVEVLKSVSLDFKGPALVALVGESGVGKSTVFDLILGFRSPDSGQITVGGSTFDCKGQALHNFLSYVPQEGFLFPGSIKDNILVGREFDQSNFDMALEMSCLQSVIAELPLGENTIVSEDGLNLSGGQRQRVGLARSLYSARPVVLLDEPTSALDTETTAIFMRYLKALSRSKLVILCTHDQEVMGVCDQVFRLKGGKFTESNKGDFDVKH